MKSFHKVRCPNCGDVTVHRRRCTICNHPLPQQPVACGSLVILLFLSSLWFLLTHIRWT
jgi:hypothetical protein